MEINRYKGNKVQTLQSQVYDSVKNDKTHKEAQGQANHESREAKHQEQMRMVMTQIINMNM